MEQWSLPLHHGTSSQVLCPGNALIMFLIPHPLAVGYPLVPSPWGEGC
jgi:hypothetical protein